MQKKLRHDVDDRSFSLKAATVILTWKVLTSGESRRTDEKEERESKPHHVQLSIKHNSCHSK